MARIFWDGAEDPAWQSLWNIINIPTRQTSPVASGVYSYRLGANAYMYRSFTGIIEGYFAVRWLITTNVFDYKTVSLRSGGTELIGLGLDTYNNNFRIYIGGSFAAQGTFKYALNTWYRLEFRVKIDDTVGIVQFKVDGILDIDYSGDTKPGAQTTIDTLYLNPLSYTHNFVYFDDIAINDTTGAVDNSWCGEGRVIYLTDNGDGDVIQLTPNTGANYAAVDELAQDGDTTYVEGDTVGEYDLYNLAASGIPAGSTINRVRPVAAAKDTIANGGKVALGLKTNNTEYFGSDLTLTNNYTSVQGTEHLVNPNTGVAWTVAELDALQVGVKAQGT